MSQSNPRDWREICEEVLRTKDEDKVIALLDELLRALDERDQKRDQKSDSPNPDDHLYRHSTHFVNSDAVERNYTL
jgi:hypothetical protein